MATRKRWLGICSAAVLGTALVAYLAATDDRFDRDTWKAQRNSPARDNPRARMVPALLDKRLRPGMTSEEISALLGEPERREDGHSIYELGVAAYGIDEEYLALEFDPEGRLLRYWISRR